VNTVTAERIRKVAAELGYRVNSLASGLPTGRTSMLAMVVSDVTNPFYAEIIRGAESAATAAGYVLLLIDTQESNRWEHESLQRVLSVVEGVILAGSRLSDSAIRMAARRRPLVVLNRDVADVPSIVLDISCGMRLAARHLDRLGHRTLTYVAGPEASWADGMRWRGLRDAAAELDQRVHRVGPYAPTIAGGRAAAHQLSKDMPSAVLTYNDQLAIGLVLALHTYGVKVPAEVSVIGFDDIFPTEIVTPALTTVAAPLRTQGQAAVKTLLTAGGTTSRPNRPRTLPVKLITRGSTARARRSMPLSAGPRFP